MCDGRSKPISRDRAVARCILDKLDVAEEMAKSDRSAIGQGFPETPVPERPRTQCSNWSILLTF